ncbi:zinc metalloprotease HtpX [Pelosinus sp. IPA-1]|uniref:zinc metalloprotease HtpX n=1 Tax=Pelosinus sp. IPA-1 TaxID=3029569 RepID=UPI0024362C01|nr:zinc metalloprotease HtpX [Pelosinus sp. IPA-1]GMA98604.1 protease [Pelosinus sp. IPA-1]
MNNLKTTLLLAALTGILMAIGGLFGGRSGVGFMLLVSLAMNLGSYWFSDKIVLSMYNAREITPEQGPDLFKMVANLAHRANLPMPRVYVIDTDVPNAFATGRSPQYGVVAVTTGIMRTLTYDELSGVVAHELAHIKNRDTLISTVVASIAGVITWIAHMAQWSAMFGMGRNDDEDNGGIIGTLFTIILAPLAATLIQLGISRSREYLADQAGGKISNNPLALASALEKIDYYAKHQVLPSSTPSTSHLFIINPLSGAGNWAMSLFSTHPTTKERVARLREQAGHH